MDRNITQSEPSQASGSPGLRSREGRRELLMFFVLAVLIWPFVAIGVVAGWGFVVWMYYMFTGPPGPV
jgi:periplasmic nitrate reductase NapE